MTYPGSAWAEVADVEEAGFAPAGLAEAVALADRLPTTALMIVRDGRIVLDHGDSAEISYVASVRKSLLSMLYGTPVTDGTIDLDRTLGDLGIDDVAVDGVDGLLPVEREARVRDLLTARSGVYHPAASPGGDEENLPERGSKQPGIQFIYNNWDFNVLGTVFEQCTGRTVFGGFRTDLAQPLGFQDFDPDRQRLLGDPARSRHLAHHLFLSGRDLARLGLLMNRGGRWEGRQLVPESWVTESTSVQVRLDTAPMDYGYLWWLPRIPSAPSGFLAAGNFGQYLFCVPELDLVIVHRRAVSDEFAVARNQTHGANADAGPERVTVRDFFRLATLILAARRR